MDKFERWELIRNEIRSCKKILIEKGYTPIFIAPYGSDNYNLNTEDSDIDLKAIIAPKLEDICRGRSDISIVIDLPSGGLCDVKTPNKMIECWKKQNVNFMELLFSTWYYANPAFEDEVDALYTKREDISRYNEVAAINCMVGMAKEKLHALCKDYPSQKKIVDKWGYAPKQLHHIKRLSHLMDRYLSGSYRYYDILRFDSNSDQELRERLIREKTEKLYETAEEAYEVGAKIVSDMEAKRDLYRPTLSPADKEIGEFLDDIKFRLVKKSLQLELSKEENK